VGVYEAVIDLPFGRCCADRVPFKGFMQKTNFRDQFTNVADACALAQSIVDTVREPVIVLDKGLRVIAASRSFYSAFEVSPEETQGNLLYALGDGQWDIPKLRLLLEEIIPQHGVMEDYEVEHDFPHLGARIMRLNARQVFYKEGAETTILLGIEDVTAQRALEQQKDDLLRQKDILLEEIQHRISNSLQIIAGIILMKANTVSSEETRSLLRDTHDRVISIATIQQQLNASGIVGPIEMLPYLEKLGTALGASMIRDARPIILKVTGAAGHLSSRQAESIGLIATELVMNALKHAFPDEKMKGRIDVAYDVDGTNWKLSVADNGVGKPDGVFAQAKTGLGTSIIKALAQNLNAKVETLAGPHGTTVSVTHATFITRAA
jgi:chemotaxis protein methyltransferase CheR